MFRYSIFLIAAMLPYNAFAQIADPADISGLVLWLDAQDVNGNGTTPANGATQTTWADKSGNGNNVTTTAGTVSYETSGMDGVNASLRFPLGTRMAGANPFGGTFQNAMTVFFVNANVTLTSNFSFSLNGRNRGINIADGRFSFHTPWNNNRVYFDAGACCGATRLEGVFPNALTETTLYTAVNDQPGNRQLLRIDGVSLDSDTTGHNVNVTRGVHLGDFGGGLTYNGRFAEVVLYNRGLSMAEIDQVECYLLAKWKLSDAPAGCVKPLTIDKTSTVWVPTGDFAAPGSDVLYEVTISKPPSTGVSNNSLFIVDSLPAKMAFYNGDVDDGGPESNPVGFSQTGTGLNFTYASDITFSNMASTPTDLSECNYVPVAGYDPAVRHICINPKGAFEGSSSTQSFTIYFRARIN